MNDPWMHGYAATPAGAALRPALLAGDPVDDTLVDDTALAYQEKWAQLQRQLDDGVKVDRNDIRTVTRTLIDGAQADSSSAGRVDLHDPLAALTSLPGGAGDFFHELMGAAPDRKRLRSLSAPFNGAVKFEDESLQAEATLHFMRGDAWAEELGGAWGSERMRTIVVNTRYAKWRDRRVRRLCRVRVIAHDVVPAS